MHSNIQEFRFGSWYIQQWNRIHYWLMLCKVSSPSQDDLFVFSFDLTLSTNKTNTFVYVQLQAELDRCHQLMAENMKKMIQDVREELHVLWEQCFVPENQRTAFFTLFTGLYGEQKVGLLNLKICRLGYENTRIDSARLCPG